MTRSIAPKMSEVQFTRDGYPINPLTGKAYSRKEIVSDSSIPYPLHVDAANPGPYWRRLTPAELAAEQQRIAKKNNARARRQSRRRALATTVRFDVSSVESQAEAQGRAMAEQVERINRKSEDEGRSILVSAAGGFRGVMVL